jgi:hypothetical protein
MFTSSPPRVPCSTSHSSPVVGCTAAACTLRWPYDQISGSTPALPTNGLSFGTDPSALMRMIFPSPLSICCDCMRPAVIDRSPCVTNNVPSRPQFRRLPK